MENQKNCAAKNCSDDSNEICDYRHGPLPSCAPLASAYVPIQQGIDPRYSKEDALTRGTLFPGLDLPFMGMINKSNPYAGTPLGELMALQFMERELQLYLDTHSDDEEAFSLLKETLALEREGRERYAQKYGPILFSDLENLDSYKWIDCPWPWSYNERTGEN